MRFSENVATGPTAAQAAAVDGCPDGSAAEVADTARRTSRGDDHGCIRGDCQSRERGEGKDCFQLFVKFHDSFVVMVGFLIVLKCGI
ncbi:MAG: hypothetical protein QNL39_05210 [Akkermansiaceae bacterium]